MFRLFHFIVVLIIAHIASAQTFSSQDPAYIDNVQAGELALNSENYDSCLIYYEEAFKIKQTSYLSTLRAAVCAFKANDQSMLDTYMTRAFSHRSNRSFSKDVPFRNRNSG